MPPTQSQFFSPNPAMTKGFAVAELERRASLAANEKMTMNGTLSITAFLLGALILAGGIGWVTYSGVLAIVAMVAALIVGIITSLKPHLAPRTALVYALLQGYVMGVISRSYNDQYEGIVVQALGLTVAITVALLMAYRSGAIKPSANFKLAVAAATGGIFLFYVVGFALSFFGIGVPLIHSNSNMGILFSLFVVALASANLVIDFDFVEEGVANGAPKYMEWYGAFGILVTLVWLYLELLRLLAKLQSRRE